VQNILTQPLTALAASTAAAVGHAVTHLSGPSSILATIALAATLLDPLRLAAQSQAKPQFEEATIKPQSR
jgi:hypothetical protein